MPKQRGGVCVDDEEELKEVKKVTVDDNNTSYVVVSSTEIKKCKGEAPAGTGTGTGEAGAGEEVAGPAGPTTEGGRKKRVAKKAVAEKVFYNKSTRASVVYVDAATKRKFIKVQGKVVFLDTVRGKYRYVK